MSRFPISYDVALLCFECGDEVRTVADRGLAVAEGIVLCERCCEQHEARCASVALPAWFDDLAGAHHA